MRSIRTQGRLRTLEQRRRPHTHTVVMIRHGESAWNLSKRFTGWCDVPLTEHGVKDAKDAGRLMKERGMQFDVAFTSSLERAWRTCALTLSNAGQSSVETVRSWRLNERHYGALQGHLKTCPKLINEFGEQQLIEWRRAYDTAPPSLQDEGIIPKLHAESVQLGNSMVDPRYYININNNNNNNGPSFPLTESLKDCEKRAFSYWEEVIAPRVKNGERVLIVAHANTIRALVKAVDKISDDMIRHLKIPNGIPLVYTLDRNLEPIIDSVHELGFQAKYLISPHTHEKMMAYESCTRKKLVALFEFIDKDKDGIISTFDLQSGMTRLLSSSSSSSSFASSSSSFSLASSRQEEQICEFEIEELLRCVPQADSTGGITLKHFLDAEANVLPGLTRLRLLQ